MEQIPLICENHNPVCSICKEYGDTYGVESYFSEIWDHSIERFCWPCIKSNRWIIHPLAYILIIEFGFHEGRDKIQNILHLNNDVLLFNWCQ
jgi:hypothetical protein